MGGDTAGENPMILPKPRFEATLNYGHVLTSLTLLIGGVVYYGQMVEWRTSVDAWRSSVESRLQTAENNRSVNLPRLNNLEVSDKLQDDRIDGINKGLERIVETLSRTNESISKIGTTVAVIEERTKKASPN